MGCGGKSANDVRQSATSKLPSLCSSNLRHRVALAAPEAFSESAIDANKRLVSGVGLAALHFVGLAHVVIR